MSKDKSPRPLSDSAIATLTSNDDGTYTIEARVTEEQLEQLLELMPKPDEQPQEGSAIQPMGWFSGSWHCVRVMGAGGGVIYQESIYENDIWKYARAYFIMKGHAGMGYSLSHGKC